MTKRRVLKLHIFDLIAAMVFLGKKVTPEDIANHLYNTSWGDEDKYDILKVVKDSLDAEMKKQEGKRPEDHYGIRKSDTSLLYWLSYSVNEKF